MAPKRPALPKPPRQAGGQPGHRGKYVGGWFQCQIQSPLSTTICALRSDLSAESGTSLNAGRCLICRGPFRSDRVSPSPIPVSNVWTPAHGIRTLCGTDAYGSRLAFVTMLQTDMPPASRNPPSVYGFLWVALNGGTVLHATPSVITRSAIRRPSKPRCWRAGSVILMKPGFAWRAVWHWHHVASTRRPNLSVCPPASRRPAYKSAEPVPMYNGVGRA